MRGFRLLSPIQKRVFRLLVVGGGLLVANAAYLLLVQGAGWLGWLPDPAIEIPPSYQLMILGHTVVGVALIVPFVWFGIRHWATLGKRGRNRRAWFSGQAFFWLGLLLIVTGFFILSEANSDANRWAWWTHAVCGVALPALYVRHRLWTASRPDRRTLWRGVGWIGAVVGLALGLHQIRPAGFEVEVGLEQALADPYPSDLLSPEQRLDGEVPEDHLFFPSAVRTITNGYLDELILTREEHPDPAVLRADLDEYGFLWREPVGAQQCIRCHPDSVAQWEHSTHRFSSFNNPFYRRAVEQTREEAGHGASQWCGACHDPAILLTGEMAGEIDPHAPRAQAGLTCLACHGIEGTIDDTGNGNYILQDTSASPYLFADAETGSLGALLHDMLLKARPHAHRRAMRPAQMGESEFCATCHKVSLPEAVNDYRWLRGQNDYDAWQNSGVAHGAARTFYLPPAVRSCQDCHMPREAAPLGDVAAENGTIRSHRFLSVNTALPALRGDDAMVARIEEVLAGALTLDLFVRVEGAPLPVPLDQLPELPAGTHELLIVVRNRGVGHTFPGGTNDSNQGWLRVQASLDGAPLLDEGRLGDDLYLDPGAHAYGATVLDAEGNRIDRRNAQDIHVVAYARVIGPGTAELVRYRLELERPGRLEVDVRLLWRKFRRVFTEFVLGPDAPAMPVIELAAAEGGAQVQQTIVPGLSGIDDWVRVNDLAIGAFLQGDRQLAQALWSWVMERFPERVDGPRNLVRVALAEGDLARAYELLDECERRAPGDPQTAWFWARTLAEDGRYADADEAYSAVLARFPADRMASSGQMRARYLAGDFEAALESAAAVLAIDPEDRVAWYHRYLCYQALGRAEEAAQAERAYQRFSIDESARAVVRDFLARHPDHNHEAQQIHWHDDG